MKLWPGLVIMVSAGGDTRHQRPPLRAAGDTLINYAHSGSSVRDRQHYQKRAIPSLPKLIGTDEWRRHSTGAVRIAGSVYSSGRESPSCAATHRPAVIKLSAQL